MVTVKSVNWRREQGSFKKILVMILIMLNKYLMMKMVTVNYGDVLVLS
jgi:hypothetical protein